jgi:hypothetical protein
MAVEVLGWFGSFFALGRFLVLGAKGFGSDADPGRAA